MFDTASNGRSRGVWRSCALPLCRLDRDDGGGGEAFDDGPVASACGELVALCLKGRLVTGRLLVRVQLEELCKQFVTRHPIFAGQCVDLCCEPRALAA